MVYTNKSYTSSNKNTSEYDKLLKQFMERMNGMKDLISQMYEALKTEGFDPMSARQKIEEDLADHVSMTTIRRALPDEAKAERQQEAAKISNKKRKVTSEPLAVTVTAPDSEETSRSMIKVATTGDQSGNNPSDVGQEDQTPMINAKPTQEPVTVNEEEKVDKLIFLEPTLEGKELAKRIYAKSLTNIRVYIYHDDKEIKDVMDIRELKTRGRK